MPHFEAHISINQWKCSISKLLYFTHKHWLDNNLLQERVLFFFLIDLYWSIIASQYRVSFWCTTKWNSPVHTHVPISPPSCVSLPSSLSHPSRSSQSTELISLCCAAASHQPTIFHSVVYICQCCSHFAPGSPSHPCPQVHSLCLHLYSWPATRFISTIWVFKTFFLDSIYMC